jgi:hypothetical protein
MELPPHAMHPGTLHNPVYRGSVRAKQYPFVLDPFQETAVACLVRVKRLACWRGWGAGRHALTIRLASLGLPSRPRTGETRVCAGRCSHVCGQDRRGRVSVRGSPPPMPSTLAPRHFLSSLSSLPTPPFLPLPVHACDRYAIALATNAKQRVIYTSPIKALSNQKFRELQARGGGGEGSCNLETPHPLLCARLPALSCAVTVLGLILAILRSE